MSTAVATHSLVVRPPWTWPWWRPAAGQQITFLWVVLIHVTAAVRLIMFPLPGWPIFLTAGALTWMGGFCFNLTK